MSRYCNNKPRNFCWEIRVRGRWAEPIVDPVGSFERATPSRWTEAQRRSRLHEHVEPALERELGQRGVLNGDGAYTAELVAWVELV